ncbi:hypothetical protein [Nostoc sp.]|uniref:hypothetical protein n=1 Tax=Nostoc sp. TaxID=1180 RepID=UPI002FFA97D3
MVDRSKTTSCLYLSYCETWFTWTESTYPALLNLSISSRNVDRVRNCDRLLDISQQCADASRATDTRLRVELESLLGTEYRIVALGDLD